MSSTVLPWTNRISNVSIVRTTHWLPLWITYTLGTQQNVKE